MKSPVQICVASTVKQSITKAVTTVKSVISKLFGGGKKK